MTPRRFLSIAGSAWIIAALATDILNPANPHTFSPPQRTTPPAVTTTPSPPQPSRGVVDLQDRTSRAHRHREARAFDMRPLLNALPIRRDGVRIDVAGLAADTRHAVIAIAPGRRSRRHARSVYRRLLAATGDSGRAYTIGRAAGLLADALDRRVAPDICGKYRVGDIRHCVADIGQAQRLLGYQPRVML